MLFSSSLGTELCEQTNQISRIYYQSHVQDPFYLVFFFIATIF